MPTEDSPQLLFAPFRGITNKWYRNAFARHFPGFDQMYTPFVSGIGHSKISPELLRDFTPYNENLSPAVPQLISNDPGEIILFGKTLSEYGFDHVNLNLGCPFSRIANKQKGCGILPYPRELDSILGKVFRDFPVKLSVKTRLGYKDPVEIIEIIKVLNQYPVHLLIIHPRIGTQVYKGNVNLEGFAQCLHYSRIPLAYNGDIYHKQRYSQLKGMFPSIKHWMPGRGALINPFLPGQIKGIETGDPKKRLLLKGFLNELLYSGLHTSKDQKRLIGSMKAVWYYLSGMFCDPQQVFNYIKSTSSIKEYEMSVERILEKEFATESQLEDYFRHGITHKGKDE